MGSVLIQGLGLAVVAFGLALIWFPLAIIFAGLVVLGIGLLLDHEPFVIVDDMPTDGYVEPGEYP